MRYAPLLVITLLGCRAESLPPGPPPPSAEFLLWAGDSTFWVSAGASGARMRGSPILLARYGGRFFEIYVADDDRSYYDAVLIGQRLYRRDLITGDSAAVYTDTLVPKLAERYATQHPAERPLSPQEEPSDDPRTVVTSELEIVDLFGPLLIFEQHTDAEVIGGESWHATSRGAVDLRSGKVATVRTLFGDSIGRRVVAEGRQRFAEALDSVLAAPHERARRASRALGAFEFDERSFTLARDGERPAVAFLVPGAGDDAEGLILPLPPIPVSATDWWRDVRATLPCGDDELSGDRWRQVGYDVIARDSPDGERAALFLRDSSALEWRVGGVQAPARRLYALDNPPVDSASRAALARAFNESALYSDDARVVRFEKRAPRRSPTATDHVFTSFPNR